MSGPHRIIRKHELPQFVGYSKSQIAAMIAQGTFPAPVPFGPKIKVWLESEIIEWQQQKIAERETAPKVDPWAGSRNKRYLKTARQEIATSREKRRGGS